MTDATREALTEAIAVFEGMNDDEINLELLPRLKAALQQPEAGEPVPNWRTVVKQPDERSLPTYGQIPWDQLGRDVIESQIARRDDFPFMEDTYPGHQIVPGINFNSLARIVDKYRYYGLPCEAAPPASADMREALEKIEERLADLAEANAIYDKDQRLSAPDKIARNNREISWLKELRCILVNAQGTTSEGGNR